MISRKSGIRGGLIHEHHSSLLAEVVDVGASGKRREGEARKTSSPSFPIRIWRSPVDETHSKRDKDASSATHVPRCTRAGGLPPTSPLARAWRLHRGVPQQRDEICATNKVRLAKRVETVNGLTRSCTQLGSIDSAVSAHTREKGLIADKWAILNWERREITGLNALRREEIIFAKKFRAGNGRWPDEAFFVCPRLILRARSNWSRRYHSRRVSPLLYVAIFRNWALTTSTRPPRGCRLNTKISRWPILLFLAGLAR